MKPCTKKEMSKLFGVSYNTFLKWLKNIPDLEIKNNQRILTPRQIEKIIDFLGEP
jgi:abortive infection bacteriophage resistance protein